MQDTAQQSPKPVHYHLKVMGIMTVTLAALALGGAGGYFAIKTLAASRAATETTSEAVQAARPKPEPKPDIAAELSSITYLMKYGEGDSLKTVFTTADKTGETIKIADGAMSEASAKTVYKIESPAVMKFSPPFYAVNNHMIAPLVGGDANDLLIFTLDGNVISKSVKQANAEFNTWLVSYGGLVKDNVITVGLSKADGSASTAQLDVSTGNMVPGSFKRLPRQP